MLSKPGMLLLGMINESSKGAYEITKMLEVMQVKWWFNISDSTVYSTIKVLERKRYITGSTEKNGNMPERTVYTISSKGKEILETSIHGAFLNMDYDTTTFSIAASYLSILPKNEIIELLNKRLQMLDEYKRGIQENISQLRQSNLSPLIIDNIERMKDIVEAEIVSANRMLLSIKEGD